MLPVAMQRSVGWQATAVRGYWERTLHNKGGKREEREGGREGVREGGEEGREGRKGGREGGRGGRREGGWKGTGVEGKGSS